MISSLDPASLRFLNGLNQIQQRSQRAQAELTTGLRISTVADDPSQLPLLLQTRSELDRAQQVNTNLGEVKSEVDTGESSLQSALTLVERAQTLASQGQSGFVSADSRTQIAGEVDGILQQLVGIANTSVGGRYIFSGDSDQTAPYSIDLTKTPPISSYQGTSSTRQVEQPDGTLFAVGKTAQEIFDSSVSQNNVFQAVNNLRNALVNNDQNALNSAIGQLKSADTYLNQQLSFYGIAQNRVSTGLDLGQNLVTALQTRLSTIQDADMTQAITEFQQASTQQQAALSSRAKIPRSSLFDYLG